MGEGPVPASVTVAVLNLSKSLICHWLVSPRQDFLAELEGNLTNEYFLNNEGLKTSASLVFTISSDARTGTPWMALRTKKDVNEPLLEAAGASLSPTARTQAPAVGHPVKCYS